MSEKRWPLQDAKNRLSELVRRARKDGPQMITLRGDDAVVVLDAAEYARLAERPKQSLVDFLRRSPLAGTELEIPRSRDTGRTVEL